MRKLRLKLIIETHDTFDVKKSSRFHFDCLIKLNQHHKKKFKTEAIIWTKRRQLLLESNNSEERYKIEWRTNVENLGMHLDFRLKFNKHITELWSKEVRAIAALKYIFNSKSALTIRIKILVCIYLRFSSTNLCE